jgi:hypothetical protein
MEKKVGAIKIIEKGESKKAKPKATYQQVRTKKGTFKVLKKVGATYYYGDGKKVFPSKLKVGEKYEWIEGAEYLELKYIGLTKNHPTKKFGSKFGDGEYLFQWDDGKYIALSYKAILDSLKTIHKKVGDVIVTYRSNKDGEYIMNRDRKGKFKGSERIAGRLKKVGATDKSHKDTKSHNVNIRVVSGIHNDLIKELESINKREIYFTNTLNQLLEENSILKKQKGYSVKGQLEANKRYITDVRGILKTLKKQKIDIRKRIK